MECTPQRTHILTTQTLADVFTKLIAYYQQRIQLTADKTFEYKIRATQKIINDLNSRQPPQIVHSSEQFKGCAGYGKKTLTRIDEILTTSTLKELQECRSPVATSASSIPPVPPPLNLRIDPSLLELQKITGIGPAKAKKLVDMNITVEKLQIAMKTNDVELLSQCMLTHHQYLGLKYIDDTQQRVPRSAIETFEKILPNFEPHTTLRTICGSYRRGKANSGDIDVLMMDPSWRNADDVANGLTHTIKQLQQAQLIVDSLTQGKVKTKYMGFIRVSGHPWVIRIDIRAVLAPRYIPALMYFTGSKDENIRLRRKALSMGYTLNEYGLNNVDEQQTQPVQHFSSEQDLYGFLNEPYVPPTER